MWTPTTRRQHSRTGLRYGSDVTDAEWLLLSPFLPAPSPCGRHRKCKCCRAIIVVLTRTIPDFCGHERRRHF